MYITQVVSYKNAWDRLNAEFPHELEDIKTALAGLTFENIAAMPSRRTSYNQVQPLITTAKVEDCWISALEALGWEESSFSVQSPVGRSFSMRALGYIKNDVAVRFIRHREIANRWLYTVSPIAVRNELIEIPISVAWVKGAEERVYGISRSIGASLEWTKDELLAVSPLAHPTPFVLIGISPHTEELQLTEINAEEDSGERNIIINRSIEFAPQYHQAGIGILSYFGTVLREKYPEHNAKVRIEQDGLRVRLIIESENGDKEVIEKALQEYEMVVRGESDPSEFFASKALVLELKNELRIAQVRIDGQRDLIEYRNEEIASLRQLIGHSLSTNKAQPITVAVNPRIVVNASVSSHVQQHVPDIAEIVQLLATFAVNQPEVELRLLDLEESLETLSSKQSPEAVKKSSGLAKLKRWLDDACTIGTSTHTFVEKVEDGIELIQKIARRYNAIAQWCGAPQVPAVLAGESK
jgi:hypothetical protein